MIDKKYPVALIQRNEINYRHGIKSSLSEMKELFSLLLAIYLSDKRRGTVEYSKEISQDKKCIEINDNTLDLLITFFKDQLSITNNQDFIKAVNNNPLFKSQLESLQVVIELFWKVGKVSFVKESSSSAERTGGYRFNKKISFSSNIIILEVSLSNQDNLINLELKELLFNWIMKNAEYKDHKDLLKKIQTILTIFSEETQFKVRKNDDSELFFQQEGVYKQIIDKHTVEDQDHKEPVGPFRILKSFVKSGLHRFLKEDGKNGFNFKDNIEDLERYLPFASTLLDLSAKKTTIYSYTELIDENNTISNNLIDKISENNTTYDISQPYQIIFFGSPGTGKSRKVNILSLKKNQIRITFHPDTDYSSFVGSYKPIMINDLIKYEFVPQSFTKSYIKAWLDPSNNYYLIIEEINRGNCAQIFGDIFQCLDRNNKGYSEYVLHPDNDLSIYLQKTFDYALNQDSVSAYKQILLEYTGSDTMDKIILPPNLYIYATMNTSDQSLFPMDSAFKRRWDWEYIPIDYDDAEKFVIQVDENNKYSWKSFIETVNPKIKDLTGSEDKELGNRFVNPANYIISFEQFRSKVLFYLWSEVYKDETLSHNSIFKYIINDLEHNFHYSDLYTGIKGHLDTIDLLKAFMKFNNVEKIIETDNNENSF